MRHVKVRGRRGEHAGLASHEVIGAYVTIGARLALQSVLDALK
jgi:hypothetical protein